MASLRLSVCRIIFSDSNLDFVLQLCAGDVDLNRQYEYGFTLFHHAVNIPEDNIEVVQEFIRAGVNVNTGNHLDYTPLHFAAIHRKPRVFKALILGGAFVNAQTYLGITALHIAVINPILFHIPIEIIRIRSTLIINELLKHEDIDCNLVDSNGDTPLMVAVKDQQIEAAVKLLRNKADPNISNKESETPLHVAFFLLPNYIEIDLLLSGANIYTVDKMGRTPVDILLQNSFHLRTNDCVKLIMKIIAFKYCITSDFKRKLECKPLLLQFFNKCCLEVDQMKIDIILGKITVHDYLTNCFNEDQFENVLLQIHKPVVDRLVRHIYQEYFVTILDLISKSILIVVLEITVLSKTYKKIRKMDDLAGLFSITDIIHLISKYLSKVDFFCLIVAFSDVKISDSMQNIRECEFYFSSNMDL